MAAPLYPELAGYVDQLLAEQDWIPAERQHRLRQLGRYVHERADRTAALVFICTHNSRRSHLAQIWAAVAAHHFGLDYVRTYSGGTEATAFNPRAVAALNRSGFRIETPGGDNPHYRLYFAPPIAPIAIGGTAPPLECWSKTFDDPANPTTDFAAVMTCSEADTNCPFIPGADRRIALPYEDPKETDGTPAEADRYDERVRQIGRELLFALKVARDSF
ncbi:protein-tyrosine-phosphatase [Neolewinella sp.]|uniref:protein-tyrosine-phosphatase n=1 Tax=Neolewinella sp. TaxID=2993543 RepID=UPI003B51F62F